MLDTAFNKPLYASLNLTGIINGSPSVNSVLPKKSTSFIVEVAMYDLTFLVNELNPPISDASLSNSSAFLNPVESSSISDLNSPSLS